MIYRATLGDTQKLLSLPETGMGYQLFEDNSLKKFVAYNAELIVPFNDLATEKLRIITRGYLNILNEANVYPSPSNQIRLISKSLISGVNIISEQLIRNKGRHEGGKGAKDNNPEYASGTDMFVRVSAYENDKRIDFKNKKLLPGTYTTTLEDYTICVKTQDDPIDRYALPNDEEIKWAFYILPKSWDKLQRGIVQSAFGHSGGGIEAYFENGTSDQTYLYTRTYGK